MGYQWLGKRVAEDNVQFHKRMEEVDQRVRTTLEKLHTAEEERQKDRKLAVYQTGDLVWALPPRGPDQLSSLWTGPHKTLRQCGRLVWEVDVGNKVRRCHAAQLKGWQKPLAGPSWPLHYRKLTDDDVPAEQDQWNVAKILRHRRNARGKLDFLVRWEGWGPEGDQWEPAASFLPVVNPIWIKYCSDNKLTVPVSQMASSSQ